MAEECTGIKENIKSILNSENTTTFLNNVTKPLGNKTRKGIIICRQDNVNCFLDNVFMSNDDNDIHIEDFGKNNVINNLIINEKRINVKTLCSKSNRIFFNSFCFREGDNFDVEKNLEKTIEKLNSFDYFLFMLIYRNRRNEDFKVKYNFYLKPVKDFYFDVKVSFKTLYGYKGENWIIQSNKEFFFLIDKNNLGKPIYSYFYNY